MSRFDEVVKDLVENVGVEFALMAAGAKRLGEILVKASPSLKNQVETAFFMLSIEIANAKMIQDQENEENEEGGI